MSKRRDKLKARLEAVSKNNVAYVEAFGAEKHWGEHKKDIESSRLLKDMETSIELLEEALENVTLKEEIKTLKEFKRKEEAKDKLEKLGLSVEDLKELLR
jgi:hypothetical protein